MKNTRFTEPQIMDVLREAESGVAVPAVCGTPVSSRVSFYKWRAKYGGMNTSMMSHMKAMEEENRRLKLMFADLSMQADLLREACFRYSPTRDVENEQIADLLIGLTKTCKTWDLACVFCT